MLWSLSLIICLPLVELLTGSFARKYPKIHEGCITVITVFSLYLSITLPISQNIYVIDFGFIKLKFMCDVYAYFFGILVNVVWMLTNLYSYSYATLSLHRHKVNDFFKYLSLSIFAVFGTCYSANLVTMFICYIALTIFTTPLITQNATKESIKARNIYLITHLSTSIILFLPAIFLIYHYTGNVDFVSNTLLQDLANDKLAGFILMLIVFGISKNCILPFHAWITKATIAPTPVSGLLHSVAAVKSGSIAFIKIVVYIFGLDYVNHLNKSFFTGGWIFYMCGITAVYAAYKAWKTTNVKHRFAYSTISQLSYILTSVMIATPLAVIGAVLHIISHSLCKIVLFYIAGIFSSVYGIYTTRDAAKLAPHIKFWIFCLAFCGASIIGIPLLPGSFGKDYMIISEFQTHHYASFLFLITGSLINVLYIYPIVKASFFTKNPEPMQIKTIPLTMRIAIILGVVIAISMSIFIHPIIAFFRFYNV
jgi:multicomponent Na+:H+ antiporter subunit D